MFKRIYFFFLSYLVATSYGQTLLLLWFSRNGVGDFKMLTYFFVHCVSALVFYALVDGKSFLSRQTLALGVLSSACGVFIAGIMTHAWQAYLVAICFGFTNVFFWTICNTLHFKYGDKDAHGVRSGIYFFFFPITGAIFSPLAGVVAEKFGYSFVFLSALLFYIIPLVLLFYLPVFDVKFEIKKALYQMENKILIFLQGCTSMFGYAFIPIFTLFFISTPFKFGNFFGYLAILSTFAALANSKISDKLRKRAFFFYFFTVLDSVTYIPMALARSIFGWQVFTGINNITGNLANPFSVTLVLDHAQNDIFQTMLGRELYLNLGRMVMLLFAIVIYFFSHSFTTVIFITSFTALLYPIVAFYQGVYLNK